MLAQFLDNLGGSRALGREVVDRRRKRRSPLVERGPGEARRLRAHGPPILPKGAAIGFAHAGGGKASGPARSLLSAVQALQESASIFDAGLRGES